MRTETTIQGLHAALSPVRASRKSIGFVATMGNLHEGHLKLVQEASQLCDVVVVSIFVNPTQFGPNEDFANYPRTFEADSNLLAEANCDILFAPSTEQIYGEQPQKTTVQVNSLADDLCGRTRPGHFTGVATVVTKLFNIVQPTVALFGEKDYQQLAIIRHLANDLCFDVDVIGVPTVRAENGLALSSRNGYLSEEELILAPAIYAALQTIQAQILDASENGKIDFDGFAAEGRKALEKQQFAVDYVEIRNPDLTPAQIDQGKWVILVAAKLGKTRLIDNLTVTLPSA
ncbi:pantoate--beta-alanine ligase [Aquirhabdus parva]|uniref:Pantothenate synthetase n=1 Tax=Aquirhabdus parva TaxID=2283318 RepID=A0A345P8A3_9GAMM|nr:pantoate--beta-alanine ligase [Aquirhabdus parva]AXI03512.1 pantoate--beta-alanine ligase [Aquirhabdus parva]